MSERTLTMPGSTDQFVLTERPAHQAGSRHEQEEPPMSTSPAKDVIRVATRAFRNGSVRGVRTYLHINCGCRIASSLRGTYNNIEDARRKGAELVEGTGDYYRTCSKSGLVKAQALGRSVRYFDNTLKAGAATFDGAGVRDGDVVVVASEGVVAIVIRAAVIAITTKRGHLIGLDTSARTFRDGLYAEIVDRAEAEARKIRATVDPLHAAPTAEEAKLADIEARVSPLEADETRPRTMFDPELTYYADGTRVVMRAKGTERTGVTFGMASGAAAYAFQAVRWDGGGADLVAPHVLHRAEPQTPADVVRTDDVQVKADGRGKWIVVRGGDFLGVIFDEGHEMKRGRFAGWSPYAGTRHNTTAFSSDPAAVVESIVQAWPVTAAEVVAQTGASLDDVLATAEQVGEEWQGRRSVLRIASAKGAATKMTREAAAEVAARLAAPAAEEAPVELPGPEWGTLKGFEAPFRLWGTEREGGRFAPCFDRKQVAGEPLVIAEVWTTSRGTARHGRDANGREIHLYGAATRFWRAPGA
ncbi:MULTISPECIES: hypothetical protein [unclassified Streptomyces]|uniref:hypothetical protein n=1 Tax=unclassified Streptomyces TaxID=2593676 RepID=UPI0004CA4FAE|nr:MULTISPECIES: hypothetical protein [unclassified Streptomyces]KOV94614.1 hypothetical protein ADL02_09695 [Streptomyces sp. NRRL WC-3723]